MISLTDPVPLRKSSVWPGYDNVAPLPIGYGKVTVSPVPYNASKTEFLLLDHPVVAVEEVTIDGVKSDGYNWLNGIDSVGHPVSLISLSEPLGTMTLAVTLRGKIDGRVGGLISNPANILYDLLVNVCGLPYDWSTFDRLRLECNNQSITAGGVVDGSGTLRSVVQEIADSVGAIWSNTMPEFAVLR